MERGADDQDLAPHERTLLVALIIAGQVFLLFMVGGMYAALLWRPSAYVMLVGLTGHLLIHLVQGVLAYRRVMARPWPKVRPLFCRHFSRCLDQASRSSRWYLGRSAAAASLCGERKVFPDLVLATRSTGKLARSPAASLQRHGRGCARPSCSFGRRGSASSSASAPTPPSPSAPGTSSPPAQAAATRPQLRPARQRPLPALPRAGSWRTTRVASSSARPAEGECRASARRRHALTSRGHRLSPSPSETGFELNAFWLALSDNGRGRLRPGF